MVLWPENNFQSDAGQTLSEQSHNQIFFPTTLQEPNNFQQATGEELQEIIDAMSLDEDVSINDYIFWSSTRDGMFNDIRRVTLGTLLDMLEIEAVAPTAEQIATIINAATAKTTPVDADKFTLTDSADECCISDFYNRHCISYLCGVTYFRDTIYCSLLNMSCFMICCCYR